MLPETIQMIKERVLNEDWFAYGVTWGCTVRESLTYDGGDDATNMGGKNATQH